MVSNSNDETNFPHKLLLVNTQGLMLSVKKLKNEFHLFWIQE